MRVSTGLLWAAALACWVGRAGADDPTAVPGPGAAPTAIPASPSAQAPAGWRHAYEGTVGVGYYERIHAGVAWRPSPRSSLGIFGGTDFSLGDTSTWDLGLSYAHALRQLPARFELGLGAKALYWQQSNPDYDWKMMSLVAGAYVARELQPGLALVLDGGAALSFSVDTTRKQNVNYAYPTRWNGSLCLELRYRFDTW